MKRVRVIDGYVLPKKFKKPQKFVAEGQSAVWYSEEGEMLGGGIMY